MKLLEDMPSAVIHRPTQRRAWVTLAAGGSLLLVAAIVGLILIAQSGGGSGEPGRGATEEGSETSLADWSNTTMATCTAVATAHPVLAQPNVATTDVAAMATAVSALAAAIREETLPADAAESSQITPVIALGDQAEQAWKELAAAASGVTPAQVTEASARTTTFVNGLIELGADCSVLSR